MSYNAARKFKETYADSKKMNLSEANDLARPIRRAELVPQREFPDPARTRSTDRSTTYPKADGYHGREEDKWYVECEACAYREGAATRELAEARANDHTYLMGPRHRSKVREALSPSAQAPLVRRGARVTAAESFREAYRR
jgi:hypothetical protein